MIIGWNDYLNHLRFSGIIVILILQEINRGNRPLYSEKLFKNILLDYVIYDHDWFTKTIGSHIGWNWHHLHYYAFNTWYCHHFLDTHCTDTDILDTDSWSCYTKSHNILYLHWLMKLTKPRLLRETGSRRNQRGVLERATPCGFGCDTWSYFLVIYARIYYYMLHNTWVQ